MILQRSKRSVVVAVADTHGGHRLGLLSPSTVLIRELDDGSIEEWSPPLTQTQEYLWSLYAEHRQKLRDFAGRSAITALHVGDLTWGDRYAEGLIPGATIEDQRVIATTNLLPLASIPNIKAVRLISGTEVHEPNSATARVARRLREQTGKGVESFHHHRLVVDGITFEFAHHGPHPGSRDWLEGNIALYHLRDRVYKDLRHGREPARVYIYAHFHRWRRVTLHHTWQGEELSHDLIILPSYSGMTTHARKMTRSEAYLVNGMCAFEVIDGELGRVKPYKAELDLRTEEEV